MTLNVVLTDPIQRFSNYEEVDKSKKMGFSISGMFEFRDERIDTYIEGTKKEVGEEPANQYE